MPYLKVLLWGFGGVFALVILVVLSGLLSPLKIHNSEPKDPCAPPRAVVSADVKPFVGLAFSGGGARAALFSAAGMAALNDRGFLDDVTHVSSVSGGGFPAAYFALNQEDICSSPARPELCSPRFFERMNDVVSHNFRAEIRLNQIGHPVRLLRPSHRLTSLQEALDSDVFVGGCTFGDIDDRRSFYFNTVSYDTGQRFVFSNAALPHPNAQDDGLLPPSVRALSFSGPDETRTTPDDFPISLAVATSAAFPPYLGPLTLQFDGVADGPSRYRHLGDGGVLENTGVETLIEAYLAQPDRTPATIYAFNAGQSLDKNASQNTADLSIFSSNLPQFVDVLLEYAGGQRAAFIAELIASNGLEIEIVTLDYLDIGPIVVASNSVDGMWSDWSNWPSGCRGLAVNRNRSPVDALRAIPTDLRISHCNALIIAEAAEFLVDQCVRARPAKGCFVGRSQ